MSSAENQFEPPERGSLVSDVKLTYASRMVALALAFATTVIVARFLGPGGRGSVAVAFGLTQLLAQVGTLGLIAANPYFLARGSLRAEQLIGASVVCTLVLGPPLVAAGLLLRVLLPDAVEGLPMLELFVALIALPALLATQFLQSILLGAGRMVAYNAIEAGVAAATLAALLMGLGVLDGGPLAALGIATGCSYAGLASCAVVLRRGGRGMTWPGRAVLRLLIGYGFRIYIATLLSFALIRVDLLLVNAYLGPGDAGIYSVATAIATGLSVLPAVVGLNLFTRVAAGGGAPLTGLVLRVTAPVFALFCLISVPAAGWLISPVFGTEFSEAAELYFWIVPGVFSLGMLTILSHHFAGEGFPVEAMVVWVAGLAVNVAINLAFLKQGAWVASLSSSVAYTLVLMLHVRLFAARSGLEPLRPRLSDLSAVRAALRP